MQRLSLARAAITWPASGARAQNRLERRDADDGGVVWTVGAFALEAIRPTAGVDTAILVLVNSTVLSHVYSPQYLNWLLPLALLLAVNILPRNWIVWSVFVILISAIVGISELAVSLSLHGTVS